jgi:hypothetical protein
MIVVVAVLVVVIVLVPATEPSAVIIVVIVSAHTDEGHGLAVRVEHGFANAAARILGAVLGLHRGKGWQAESHCERRRRKKNGKSGCHGVVSLDLMLAIWAPDLSRS